MQNAEGQPYRDICEVRRTAEFQIMISSRGNGYGNVYPFMAEEGSEEEVFLKVCAICNLEWIDPLPEMSE